MSDTRVAVRPYVIGPSATSFVVPAAAFSVLELHLDASVVASVHETSTNVSQWDDQSGNGRNFTQAVGANQPTYPGVTQNGLNTMSFVGVTPTFLDCTLAINQRFLVFAVLINIGSVGEFLFDDQVGGANRVLYGADDGAGFQSIYAGASDVLGTTNLRLTWAVMCGDYNGATSALYYNGTSEDTGDAGTNNMATMRLGCRYDGTTVGFSGNLAELRIYTNPQAGDITSITNTLRTKWGI